MISPEINKKIGERLKNIREFSDLTLDQLGEITGIGKNTIWKIEKGTRAIRGDELILISKTLKISPNYLLDIEQPNPLDLNNRCNEFIKEIETLTKKFTESLKEQFYYEELNEND